MRSSFPPKHTHGTPTCPTCGSNQKVVRMPDSLTPFERPNMRFEEAGGRYFCQGCSHDFEHEPEGEQP
jgi:hypothetical protein